MAKNEKTSQTVASIAARGVKDPGSLTKAEIKAISATALSQAPDQKKSAAKAPAKPTTKAAAAAPAKVAKPVAKAPAKAAAKPVAKAPTKKK